MGTCHSWDLPWMVCLGKDHQQRAGLVTPQRHLVKPLILDSMKWRQRPMLVRRAARVTRVKGVCSGTSCLLFILTSAGARCWSYFRWLTDYRRFPPSSSKLHDPIIALNLCVCMCVCIHVHACFISLPVISLI